jgi:hypothetical protein
MSLLIDYSGIAFASYYANPSSQMDEGFIRHMILNSVRMYVTKYSKDYGDVYLACDSSSWRRNVFPEYKGARRKDKESGESKIDWKEFYRVIHLVEEELRQFFPYKIIRAEGAEADDVIAYLVESTQEFGNHENVMIISSDHDFIQLQKYGNVKQFSPIAKKMVTEKEVDKYTFEQILRGCAGDGVPNFLSDDDTFMVEEKRQKPLASKRVESLWMEYKGKGRDILKTILSEYEWRNFTRNELMIDLSRRPEDVSKNIQSAIDSAPKNGNSKVYNYLIEKRCRNLVSCVDEFFPKKK